MEYVQAIIGLALIVVPFFLTLPIKIKADKVEDLFDRRVNKR